MIKEVLIVIITVEYRKHEGKKSKFQTEVEEIVSILRNVFIFWTHPSQQRKKPNSDVTHCHLLVKQNLNVPQMKKTIAYNYTKRKWSNIDHQARKRIGYKIIHLYFSFENSLSFQTKSFSFIPKSHAASF